MPKRRSSFGKCGFKKSFADQVWLLPPDEEIPSTRVVVMGMVVHFLATGERLFPGQWVRCNDQDSDGCRVSVGNFDSDGFIVSYGWGDDRYSVLGLSASRKC